MSDPGANHRPINDLQEFETRLRQLHPANQADAQTSVISGEFAAIEVGLLGRKQPQAEIIPEAERSKARCKSPNARAPVLGGDFAAIEAGLLGGLQDQATARVSHADVSNAFPSQHFGSDRSLHLDEQPGSLCAGAAEGRIKSRRPRYAVVAVVIAGMAGIGVSFDFESRVSGPSEIAMTKAETGSAALGLQTPSGADVPAQDAAVFSKPSEPSPVALIKNSDEPLDLPQAEKTPLVVALIGSQAPRDSRPAAVPAPTPVQAPAEPVSKTASIEPDKVKYDLIRPDGRPLSNGRPSQSDNMRAPFPPQRPPATARARSAKTAVRGAKTPKSASETAATNARGDGEARRISKKASAKPASPIDAAPAPMANAEAEAPATQSNPASTGAFEFIQTAMNSLTTTTAKLLEWGGIETGSRP